MPVITQPCNFCTVIVTVDAQPELMPDLESHARTGLKLFPEFDGFLSGALHRSVDGARLVQYLQWTGEDRYLACVNAPEWDALPSTQRFMEIVHSRQATVDVRTFTVVAAVDAPQAAAGPD